MEKIAQLRNWIGKFFLLALGMLMLVAVFYRDIGEMLLLLDKPAPKWTNIHYWFIFIGCAFTVGGLFLNNVLDGLSAGFKNFVNKFSK